MPEETNDKKFNKINLAKHLAPLPPIYEGKQQTPKARALASRLSKLHRLGSLHDPVRVEWLGLYRSAISYRKTKIGLTLDMESEALDVKNGVDNGDAALSGSNFDVELLDIDTSAQTEALRILQKESDKNREFFIDAMRESRKQTKETQDFLVGLMRTTLVEALPTLAKRVASKALDGDVVREKYVKKLVKMLEEENAGEEESTVKELLDVLKPFLPGIAKRFGFELPPDLGKK